MERAAPKLAASRIDALYIYPVKSCAGIAILSSAVTRRGLAFDRRFMIVDENRHFVTQREHPRLALVKTRIDGGRVTLTTSSDSSSAQHEARSITLDPHLDGARVPVVVWKDEVPAVPCDARASALLSDFLGVRVTLVFMPDETERIVDLRFASPSDIVSFADGFPVLVASRASLDAVNDAISDPARGDRATESVVDRDARIGIDRFRPNIVLDGTRAFEEDEHPGFSVSNALSAPHPSRVSFALVKPCSRCVIVNIDPRTGESQKEPLATLARFRARDNKTYFGMNALVRAEGSVAVGDEIAWDA